MDKIDEIHYPQLVQRYADGIATEEELEVFFHLLQQGKLDAYLVRSMNESAGIEEAQAPVRKMGGWKKWMVAAGVVGVLGLGGYLVIKTGSLAGARDDKAVAVRKDVPAPDKNRAMITLADGRIIYLDSLDAGTISTQNGITIVKNKEGQLEYKNSKQILSGAEGRNSELVYNTLTNPRGSKVIDMTLADGSHVWLNAGSSITYPVAFIGKDRNVKMNGEAYFEISHDAQRPFIVSKGDLSVTVLGTHFNVNAYEDEDDIKVTLLEGSVKITNPASSVIIKPGQQAVGGGTRNSKLETRNSIDLNEVMSWKNGLFNFDKTDIRTILRQFARWYDVEVIYEGPVSNRTFFGIVNRSSSLNEVLSILKANGIKFRIEGKRLFVEGG